MSPLALTGATTLLRGLRPCEIDARMIRLLLLEVRGRLGLV